MKILMFSLLLALGLNANEVVYGSKSGKTDTSNGDVAIEIVELKEGETLQVLKVGGYRERDGTQVTSYTYLNVQTKYQGQEATGWQRWRVTPYDAQVIENDTLPIADRIVAGPCKILIYAFEATQELVNWNISYKLTKPAASNTTTSAPILLPPTPNAAASWFVKLQMSSDLKTWEDVQAGQFLGSDAARFFRIQTTAAE